jgi:DNA invertase Pin-like site-specific DNA recombinase
VGEKENILVAAIARAKAQMERGITATTWFNWAVERLETHRKHVTSGVESGKARRKDTADRDARITEAVTSGSSQKEVARANDISDRQVRNIIKRPKSGSEAS